MVAAVVVAVLVDAVLVDCCCLSLGTTTCRKTRKTLTSAP